MAIASQAQVPGNSSLNLGSVIDVVLYNGTGVCPSSWSPVTECYTATVTGCGNNGANVDDIGLTFGGVYAGTSNPQGTVVFFTGGPGTSVWDANMDVAQYTTDYDSLFEVVYVAWDSAWEEPNQSSEPSSPGGNILLAACRPATFLSYINSAQSGFHNYGAMCAQGTSAGSAAIGYSMSWYGASNYLTNVELLSGPVLSKIGAGCNYVNRSTNETLCGTGANYCTAGTVAEWPAGWTDRETYTSNDAGDINTWSSYSGCTASSGTGNVTDWSNMSIVDGVVSGTTPVYNFSTQMHGWLCGSYQAGTCDSGDYCPNNSASEGGFFYNKVTDNNMKVTGVETCYEAENVDKGTDPDSLLPGNEAIENNMNSLCAAP